MSPFDIIPDARATGLEIAGGFAAYWVHHFHHKAYAVLARALTRLIRRP